MIPLAQLPPDTFWNAPHGSTELWGKILFGLLIGIGLIFALMAAPTQLRRPIIVSLTFLSGLFYVAFWAFPSPIDRAPDSAPRNAVEGVSFWLADAQPLVATFANVIAAFLIGLGVYSLLRIHLRRLMKMQKDWFFSVVLLTSLVAMVVFGYWDWIQRRGPAGAEMSLGVGWGPAQYGKDILFDGLLQQMDAGMFSIVAFYILSAAYRAFRARSAEATILLTTALIVMLSLLGVVELAWNGAVDSLASNLGANEGIVQNLRLTEISGWIRSNLQTPSIRGIEFGVGIGLLAMGLRLWLSLEKTGGNV